MGSVKENRGRAAKTICAMCHNRCRIEVHLKGNTIKKIVPDQEGVRQRLCVKSQAISDFEYSNQRLINPLRRVNGNFKMISWDEALDFTATQLNHIKDKYGPESLALYYGNGVTIQQALGLLRLWSQAFGTPNFCDMGCVCYWSKKIADITEVPAHLIRAAAEMYATTKPATMISGHPVNVTTHGFQLNRSRAILIAITGNLDIEGGNLINPPGISRLLRFARDDYEYLKAHKPTFTADRYPLCGKPFSA